jgi:hypothetical protein
MNTAALWIRRTLPIFSLLLAAASGCASMSRPQFFPNENAGLLHASKDADQILVVPEGVPSVPYRIVGSMDESLNSAFAGTYATNLSWFIDRFRERAAQVGADGIMNLKIVRSGTLEIGTGNRSMTTIGSSGEIYEMTADAFVLLRP